jgi:hypothetical protein
MFNSGEKTKWENRWLTTLLYQLAPTGFSSSIEPVQKRTAMPGSEASGCLNGSRFEPATDREVYRDDADYSGRDLLFELRPENAILPSLAAQWRGILIVRVRRMWTDD